jgi:multicomponent K+:H+ antiporter subunit D
MSHLIALMVVLPAMTAALLVLGSRHSLQWQRIVSIGSATLQLAMAAVLATTVAAGPQAYFVGNWPAPYGIVLVLDHLSALLLVLSAVVALGAVIYAVSGWDGAGRHFHALFHFQLLGINGAFLTGDLFNLFVFFEIMLIASYGLMLHGGGPWRLKAGFHYVAINLVSSAVFLFAVGLVYGVTGTVNMADLATKVPRLADGDQAMMRVAAVLLFSVFALKCALVPLHWWLPSTYAAAPAPAVALFAVLTKVGAYSIIRTQTLILGTAPAMFADKADKLLFGAAMLTIVLGALGVLGSKRLLDLASYSVIASMGTLLVAMSGFDARSLAAALYYLVHSTLIGAALFLLVDMLAACRARAEDRLVPAPFMRRPTLFAGLFLLTALAAVGLPPLSGFVAKLAVLDGLRRASPSSAALTWTVILLASFVLLVGYARAGSILFWKASPALAGTTHATTLHQFPFLIVGGLLLLTGALSAFAGPLMEVMHATARELLEPTRYVRAVLGTTTASIGEP